MVYWHGYLSGAAYAEVMPLPLTVSCFSKIEIGFTCLVPAHPDSHGKKAIKRACVCVVGNVGDKSVSNNRLHASETQQLSYLSMAAADDTPICYLCGVGGEGQPSTNDGPTCNTP